MFKSIFFIGSALCANSGQTVYSDEERLKQTIDTIKSIDKYCDNNKKFIFDSSPRQIPEEFISEIVNTGTDFCYTGNNPDVNHCSMIGAKSIAECLSFLHFLQWFESLNIQGERIYKISGRYTLNDNFDINYRPNNFVFTEKVKTWMPEDMQKFTGVEYVHNVRLWHMPFNFLPIFKNELVSILNDCIQYNIDAEHSYFKNLNKHGIKEVKIIGLSGNLAPTGECINE